MKILYVATVVKTHIMQFHIAMLKILKENGCTVDVIARNDYDNALDCIIPFCDNYYSVPISRQPFNISNIKAYRQIRKIVKQGNYDLIHCHTPVAGALTRLASNDMRKKGTKVLYTAHGFHFYKGAPWVNWALYYPVEKICARITDAIITINEEDYNLARKKFLHTHIEYVPGVGVDIKHYQFTENEKISIRREIRDEFLIPQNAFLMTYVGELIKRKNHRMIIELMRDLPKDVYLLIVGSGKELKNLRELAKREKVSNRVVFAGYRKNIHQLYAASDMCVLTSVQEGLPVALMEGMASGLPCLASDIRGCRDLMKFDKEMLFKPNNPEKCRSFILKLYNNPKLRRDIGFKCKEAVAPFDISIATEKMRNIYRKYNINLTN